MPVVILEVVPIIILSYTSQVLFKMGASGLFANRSIGDILQNLPEFFRIVITNWQVLLGFVLAGLGSLFYLFALSKNDFTVVYPVMGALGFLILPVIGYFILHEHISLGRLLGIVIISIGMVIVAINNK